MKILSQLFIALAFSAGISAQCIMICNTDIQVDLDANGDAVITPDLILEPGSCSFNTEVQLESVSGGIIYPSAPQISVSCQDLGDYVVRVTGTDAGGVNSNSCWTNISINLGSATCSSNIPPGHIPVEFDASYQGPYASNVYLNGTAINKINNYQYSIDPANIVAGQNALTFDGLNTSAKAISSLDMVLAQRVILELESREDISLIAADIDRSNYIGVGDIVLSRQLILGILNTGSSFFFSQVNQDYGGLDPFDFGQNVYTYRFMDSDLPALDLTFNPYQSGDVNNSYSFKSNNSSGNRSLSSKIRFTDIAVEAGQRYAVDLHLEEEDIAAIQLSFLNQNIQVESVESTYTVQELQSNQLAEEFRLSYLSHSNANEFSITLNVLAQKDGMLSDFFQLDDQFNQQIVLEDLTDRNISLVQNSPTGLDDVEIGILRISPNPMTESTRIELPAGISTYTLSITDLAGRLVQKVVSSDQILDLERAMFTNSGLYIIQVENEKIRLTQKLIVK